MQNMRNWQGKVCADFSPDKWTYLSKMHCTSKLSTSHTSMLSSWKASRWEAEFNKRQISITFHVLHGWSYLWNKRDVYSCIRFYEFDKYLSSNVPQELCNNNNMVTCLAEKDRSFRWTEITFTTHPLCALEWRGHPLCYCDLFSIFSQIQ